MAAVSRLLALLSLVTLLTVGFCVNLRLDMHMEESEEEIDLEVEENRECYGSNSGFTYSGTFDHHYQNLKRRYKDCDYVNGNLEITHIMSPTIDYDLSFLRTIRYVSGYVLLGLISEVEEIPLSNLEVIRGNTTLDLMNDSYSLIVVLTYSSNRDGKGLKSLLMPKLKEISEGKVLFVNNPYLGYVNTIDWEPILKGHRENAHFLERPYNESVSNTTDPSICPGGARWGDDPSLCQAVGSTIPCHEDCHGRCFGSGENECCHDTCAVGCLDDTINSCFVCKDYKYADGCVGFCPHRSYPKSQECVKY